MSMFKKATKKQAKLRLAIAGASGSGKTYTALTIGKYIGQRMAVVDTERGSASKYAGDVAEFETLGLDHFAVPKYLQAIKAAADEGFDVLVIDSLSHAWAGKGGILEEADKRGGKFGAWRELTPMQQSLVDAILAYPGHVICTMRSKMAYEVSTDESRGRKETKVEKIGLAPVQRDDMSYEFDVMFDMDEKNNARVTKSRCPALSGQVISKPGKDVADALMAWLSDGEAQQERPLAETAPTSSRSEDASTQTRAASSRTSSESPSSTTATGQPTTTTSPDQPHDIDYWLNGHNGVYARAVKAGAAEDVGVDEYGLQLPSLPKPTFSDAAKVHAGKAYDEVPAGFLREVIFAKPDFAKQAPNVRLWVGYLVARHEIGKLAKAIEDAAAEQALTAQGAEQSASEAAP
jgi:hypothetical protein